MLQGWELALTLGVHSQVLGCRMCIINPQELWTYTLFLKVVSKTTHNRHHNTPTTHPQFAADGGTVAECPSVVRRASACGCRAGYRRAQDLTGQDSAALGGLSASTADGGPVGGCANCRVLLFAAAAYCRADRRHSSSGSCRRREAWRSSWSTPRTEFSSDLR